MQEPPLNSASFDPVGIPEGKALNQRTLEDLEFEKIRSAVCSHAASPEGITQLAEQQFFIDNETLASEHDRIAEIHAAWDRTPERPQLDFPDIGRFLKRAAAEGNVLEGTELFDIARFLASAGNLVRWFKSIEDFEAEVLAPLLGAMPDLSSLQTEIFRALDSPGSVKESHPRIRPLIQALDQSRRDRSATADQYVKTLPESLQNDRAVIRDGRIVLPVRSAEKARIPGIFHGSSSTGATLFIEPIDLMDQNNRVSMAEERIAREIRLILRDLTAMIRREEPAVAAARAAVGSIDRCLAKAAYARSERCCRAESAAGGIHLIRARHPLLGRQAVPIDVRLGPELRAMVMSGPNAGGKTVTLKTIGLLALMNQFGLFIPAAEGSALPLYEQIITDIGDDQSIQESLSTFSGHMKHISEMLRTIDRVPASLVILDELGSGTDPVEGAALARAIMEYSVTRASLTLITSHHAVLKQYAYAADGMVNASMEFDEQLKTPTFRVISGIPGESRALETAARMDMPESVINAARSYLSSEALEISTVIRGLERRRTELDEEAAAFRKKQAQLQELKRSYDLKMLQVRQKEQLLRRSDLSRVAKFAEQARSTLENLVRELKEGELTREKTKKVKQFIAELDDREHAEQDAFERDFCEQSSSSGETEGASALEIGMEVMVGSAGKQGTILKRDRGGYWTVLIDSIKITLPERDIRPIHDAAAKKGRPRSTTFFRAADSTISSTRPELTIDVRGLNLQEAIERLQRQIDAAVMHGMRQFSVIHGRGDGILQSGIHDFLGQFPAVESYCFALPEDGGYGKTYVNILS